MENKEEKLEKEQSQAEAGQEIPAEDAADVKNRQEQAGTEPDQDAEGGRENESCGCEQEAPEEEKEPEKKGFFGKKKEKKDAKDAQIEDLTDRLRRSMAEFDNFRKRTEKEKSSMYEIGARDVIEKILPVVDNFERGLATVPEEAKGTPFEEGMEKIYKQLMKTLDDMGVKPIEAVGKEFDPNLHNAVMHVEDEKLGENIVAAELQKGYTYRDSVVRHSMVQVAN